MNVVETNERVDQGDPTFLTFFHWRARRERDRLNAVGDRLGIRVFRWEVVKHGRRYGIAAFQNRAVP